MLGSKSGLGILLRQEFPNLFLWHCQGDLYHRLESSVHDAIKITNGISEFKQFLDSLYSIYSLSAKNSTELKNCAQDLDEQFRKIGKVFTILYTMDRFFLYSG